MAKKPRLSAREKAISMTVDGIIKHAIDGVQIPIFDLSKISDAGNKAAKEADAKGLSDTEIENAILAAVNEVIAKVRKN